MQRAVEESEDKKMKGIVAGKASNIKGKEPEEEEYRSRCKEQWRKVKKRR
jgi:hypothetical protein